MMSNNTLEIIIPCYNEQDIFDDSLNKLLVVIKELIDEKLISDKSNLLFVDDGSKDSTWELIQTASKKTDLVNGLKLSKNCGHQIALLAGLENSNADITISIDADLQDDINIIKKMIIEYHQGFDIVYGVRSDRKTDSFFKKTSAVYFYKTMKKLGVNQVENHADFRLMSRRSIDALSKFKEKNLYIRGLVPLLGFQSTKLYYSRSIRLAGETKYPLKKMLALALQGITSMTVTPLRIISVMGMSISFLSVIAAIYTFYLKFSGETVEGWSSVFVAIFFLGGVQMLSLGVIGEYIGKIYLETKSRPNYFIDKKAK